LKVNHYFIVNFQRKRDAEEAERKIKQEEEDKIKQQVTIIELDH